MMCTKRTFNSGPNARDQLMLIGKGQTPPAVEEPYCTAQSPAEAGEAAVAQYL